MRRMWERQCVLEPPACGALRDSEAGEQVCACGCSHVTLCVYTHAWHTHLVSTIHDGNIQTKHTHTNSHSLTHIHTHESAWSLPRVQLLHSVRLPRGGTHGDRCLRTRVSQWELPASCWGWGPV